MASKRAGGRVGVMVVAAGLLGSIACSDDGTTEQNVLPTTSGSGTGTGSGEAESGADVTADTTSGGGVTFPATYRFDCIDVIELGDGDGDGEPDGTAIQASLLETTWAADIDAFRLNVMLTVRERDDAAGSAAVVVGSGIGATPGDLCTEPTTAGVEQVAAFDAGVGRWQPSAAEGTCSEPAAAGGEFGGTYDFEISAAETVYVYAEDDDGTVFNCVAGGGGPSAVPLHAVRATVTVDPSEQSSAGRLTGCLLDSEAQGLCSCLGECTGSAHPSCGGCPDGSAPLAELLGTVMPTDNCTQIMGARAYDLTVGFTTTRLPLDEPMACGG